MSGGGSMAFATQLVSDATVYVAGTKSSAVVSVPHLEVWIQSDAIVLLSDYSSMFSAHESVVAHPSVSPEQSAPSASGSIALTVHTVAASIVNVRARAVA